MTRMNRWTVPRRRRPVCAVPAQRMASESGCRRTKGGEHPGAGHACDRARVFPDHLRETTTRWRVWDLAQPCDLRSSSVVFHHRPLMSRMVC
jgi:hypothetical protein